MTGTSQRSDRLAVAHPEVTWRGKQLRVFLPAARPYGGRHGGAVALLSRADAEDLARQLARRLVERPDDSRVTGAKPGHEGTGGRA
jgi:hypothetical protein